MDLGEHVKIGYSDKFIVECHLHIFIYYVKVGG